MWTRFCLAILQAPAFSLLYLQSKVHHSHLLLQVLLMRFFHGSKRHPKRPRFKAHQVQRRLHRDRFTSHRTAGSISGIAFSWKRRASRHIPSMNFATISWVSGRNVGQHGDHALPPVRGQKRHDLVVVAGIDIQCCRRTGWRSSPPGDIAAGFLYRHDVFHVLRQIRQCLRRDIDAGTALDIVQDHRNLLQIPQSSVKCAISPLLGGFIVIRRHQQQAVRAVFFRFLETGRPPSPYSWNRSSHLLISFATFSMAKRITSRCSSWDSVEALAGGPADNNAVPFRWRSEIPEALQASDNSPHRFSVIGVTMATPAPVKST